VKRAENNYKRQKTANNQQKILTKSHRNAIIKAAVQIENRRMMGPDLLRKRKENSEK
jgi:hypothetical protein